MKKNMEIYDTGIPDVTEENLDESKIELADSIIEQTYPLFDSEMSRLSEQLGVVNEEIKHRDSQIRKEKDDLNNLLTDMEKKKKVLNLINKVERLINLGAGTDGSLRHELTVLLKVCDTMKDERLDDNIRRMKSILKKRYSSNG